PLSGFVLLELVDCAPTLVVQTKNAATLTAASLSARIILSPPYERGQKILRERDGDYSTLDQRRSMSRRARRGAVLLVVETQQLEQIRNRERSEEQSQQSEVAHAGKRADERDDRMNVRHAAIHERPNEIVDVARDAAADDREHGRCAETTLREQHEHGRQPHERAAEHRKNGRERGDGSPEQRV